MDDTRDAVNKVLTELEVGDALQLTRSASGSPATAPGASASDSSDAPVSFDPERAQVVEAIGSGAHRDVAVRNFSALDVQRAGTLDWNSGKIRNFIKLVFEQLEIRKRPEEAQIYSMYCTFDTD